MLLAIIILIITCLCTFTAKPYWDYVLLALQTVYGLALIATWILMSEFGGSGFLLMILFNPLPAIFWKWRRHWELPYAVLLCIGIIVLVQQPHMLVDPAFTCLAMAYVVLYTKDTIRQAFAGLKRTAVER